MEKKATLGDVRRKNRAMVVRHLLLEGQTSRVAVGAATGLSPATITTVINGLLEDGSIIELGLTEPENGRPRTLLGLNRNAAWVLGADVGEAAVTVGLFDLDLNRLGEKRFPFSGRRIDPVVVMQSITEGARDLLDQCQAPPSPLLGLGLGVPGIVQTTTNPDGSFSRLVHAQVVGWDAVTFDRLTDILHVPVLVDNGAKTTTLAEHWFGAIRGCDDAVMVLIGAGAGAGIISNGALLRGSSASAGEWGHTKISMDGPRCRCGARGCVETFVGAAAVLQAWRGIEAVKDGEEAPAVDQLFEAARHDDYRANRAVDDLVEHLGVALSNLVNLYNPSKVVLGGWFGDIIATNLLDRVTDAVRASSLDQPGAEVAIERSTLGHDGITLGAATLMVEQFIETGWPT